MPVQQAIWRLGENSRRLQQSKIASEKSLEDFIVQDPEILSPNWMLIGRQVQTDYRGFIDLIALQPDGTPVIIELKKDRTPREVLAQTLDYASWVEELTPARLQTIYERFTGNPQANLNLDFENRFKVELQEEALGRDHLMVIVAAELDNSTERIVKFLAKRNVNINVLFFQVFDDEAGQLLSRVWLVDPVEAQVQVTSASEGGGAWNGEYYVSFGEDESRKWADAREYGFITAAGGPWYTQTLGMLGEGDRVWVNIPRQGFVGVGRVTGATQSIDDFEVLKQGKLTRFAEIPGMDRYSSETLAENKAWFVPIEWIATVPIEKAIKQVGFFGNQNTVAKPRSEKWEHTVAVLKKKFSLAN